MYRNYHIWKSEFRCLKHVESLKMKIIFWIKGHTVLQAMRPGVQKAVCVSSLWML